MDESNELNIGIIGTDTSHSVAFAELLNDRNHAWHLPGGRIVAAYKGGSPDFELSISRVEGFAARLQNEFGVRILAEPEQVAESCDAILLLAADGRAHRSLFGRIAPFGKPVFIDKPLATNTEDAKAIAALAERYGVPVMTASALRFAEALREKLDDERDGKITGADCCGPIIIEPTQGGYFWYFIHAAEMLFAALGPGCGRVTAFSAGDQEMIVGVWKDGRIGTVRGSSASYHPFSAVIHRERNSAFAEVSAGVKPFYASLLEQVFGLFQTGMPAVPMTHSVEVIRFLEAANESRASGSAVAL